ncbi:hypothetical protein [Cryobacterium sp.]|jgi:hypothetical protein|uniref:hypothetical protein n=1 Tax=Cryobacterium sp. TaxID=1926290 RepID=UPI00262650A4|nr:hypothetical protein [Cryobacterium sp.]
MMAISSRAPPPISAQAQPGRPPLRGGRGGGEPAPAGPAAAGFGAYPGFRVFAAFSVFPEFAATGSVGSMVRSSSISPQALLSNLADSTNRWMARSVERVLPQPAAGTNLNA